MSDYFPNLKVEALVTSYLKTGCTDIKLRDEIMSWAVELIGKVILKCNLHNIYGHKGPGGKEDLVTVAWIQIEKTLYKFDDGPGHTKIFNMWTSIARNVMLAHIKADKRDTRYSNTLRNLTIAKGTQVPIDMTRFVEEARKNFQFDDKAQAIIGAIEQIVKEDEKPWEGIAGKVMKITGLKRPTVAKFFKHMKLTAHEYTDSPVNKESGRIVVGGGASAPTDDDY